MDGIIDKVCVICNTEKNFNFEFLLTNLPVRIKA